MSHGSLTFLGTGTSVGVPMIGCHCDVCRSDNPRNHRFRSSVVVTLPEGRILIDTTPEMRLQFLREKIDVVHAVLYTHYHVDHLFGLDDLRLVANHLKGPVPIYCTEEVEGVIRQCFSYVFVQKQTTFVPNLEFRRIDANPFEVLGHSIIPIPLKHSHFNVFGFRFGDLAYCTDVSEIPETSWPLLSGVKTLILDCLRYKSHPAHLGLNDALEVIQKIAPERAWLTHMSHEFDYAVLNPQLPEGVQMAWDGLKIEF